MNYISGKDTKDSTTSNKINKDHTLGFKKKNKKYKILFSNDFLAYDGIDLEIKEKFLEFISNLKNN